ncbi:MULTISPECIES: hypothetical protein [Sphingobacterium]|uniref:Uncharacterized protein n=2 Tax=Sphingobacterium TaxID=28453 RepID=A0A2X2IQS8_SPHMU|nr:MULTISPECIES: hypothetical protein [Sphingobacterium]QRQ59864.1 hypothetical protein I6J33_17040 [Sphingobacterium multivorum]SPZ83654.1 Uncharacterised protein [Sphingobacterium multivorum]
MVDLERRKMLAYHLRHLVIGRISNDEFEEEMQDNVSFGYLPEQYYSSKQAKLDDPIIRPMLELSWCLYSDLGNHKLTDKHQLADEELKNIARIILFLNSNLEYEWPYFDRINPLIRFSFKDLLFTILSLGQHYNVKLNEWKVQFEKFKNTGDHDLWPFISKEQYEQQLKKQPFLWGRKPD